MHRERALTPVRHNKLTALPPFGGTGRKPVFVSENPLSHALALKSFRSTVRRGAPCSALQSSVLRITGGRKADDRLNRQRTRSDEDEQAGEEARR